MSGLGRPKKFVYRNAYEVTGEHIEPEAVQTDTFVGWFEVLTVFDTPTQIFRTRDEAEAVMALELLPKLPQRETQGKAETEISEMITCKISFLFYLNSIFQYIFRFGLNLQSAVHISIPSCFVDFAEPYGLEV